MRIQEEKCRLERASPRCSEESSWGQDSVRDRVDVIWSYFHPPGESQHFQWRRLKQLHLTEIQSRLVRSKEDHHLSLGVMLQYFSPFDGYLRFLKVCINKLIIYQCPTDNPICWTYLPRDDDFCSDEPLLFFIRSSNSMMMTQIIWLTQDQTLDHDTKQHNCWCRPQCSTTPPVQHART